jgi:hypothetical protein
VSQAIAHTTSRVAPVPALRSLRSRFKGAVIAPGRDGWDAATQAFNTTVSQQPALAVVPDDIADVIAVVEFAQGLRPPGRGSPITGRCPRWTRTI